VLRVAVLGGSEVVDVTVLDWVVRLVEGVMVTEVVDTDVAVVFEFDVEIDVTVGVDIIGV
jgi:hypothetical protein